MHVALVSLLPEMFAAVTEHGVSGRAVQRGAIKLSYINPRDYTDDVHRSVDDRPYGGGPGMVMKVEPMARAITAAREALGGLSRVVCLSPQGRQFNHEMAVELATEKRLVMVSGRYEGIDERLLETETIEELSIGDYVLSGGELAAMVVLDAIVRQLPGVLGHQQSASEDSFANGLLDCPHYTRPEEYQGLRVPEVLLGGNHQQIKRWRLKQALMRTKQRRPNLLKARVLTDEESELLAELDREQQ